MTGIQDAALTRIQSEKQAEPPVWRRRFLEQTIHSLMSVIAGAIGITSGLYLFIPPTTRKQSDWVDAGALSDLPVGTPQNVRFERSRVDGWKVVSEQDSAWVVKDPNGSLTAFSPFCTHLGCAYQWTPSAGIFSCPCHGSRFSRSGQVINGPATRPLDRYEVRRVGSNIWLGPIVKPRNL